MSARGKHSRAVKSLTCTRSTLETTEDMRYTIIYSRWFLVEVLLCEVQRELQEQDMRSAMRISGEHNPYIAKAKLQNRFWPSACWCKEEKKQDIQYP